MAFVQLVLLLVLLGQEPPATPLPGSIEGIVTNVADGKPLRGATVNLWPPTGGAASISGTTDEEGKFILRNVPAGSRGVLATLPGFAKPNAIRSYLPYGEGTFVTVSSGEQVKGIHLRLAPTYAISGRLLDENDQPASSMRVYLGQKAFNSDGSPGVFTPQVQSVLSDDKGNYRLYGVPAGEYFVQAQATSSEGVTSYYPGVPFADAAVPVVVSTSELGGIDFKLGGGTTYGGTTYTVSLKIAGLQELPPDFRLSLRPKGKLDRFGPSVTLLAKEDARYTIPNVPPGSYTLTILSNPREVQTVDVDVDRNIDLGTVAFRPRTTIEGHVIFAAGAPTAMTVILQAEYPSILASGAAGQDDGSFAIPRLPANTYKVSASFLGDRYLASARYNGRDVLGPGLSVDSTSEGKLELVIDGPHGSANGTVRNATNEPVSDAFVVLVPAPDLRKNADFYATAYSDQQGRFVIERIRPGEYTLFAWEFLPPFAYRNADWLKQYEPLELRITVDKGSQLTPNLRVIPRPK